MNRKMFVLLFATAALLCSCSKKNGNADQVASLESKINALETELKAKTDQEQAVPPAKTETTKSSGETVPQESAPKKKAVNSFIRITDPQDEGQKYLYNVYDVNEVKLTFSGEVSSDCTSIRVLWAPHSADYIQAYLEGRKQKLQDIYIDDYELKQFKPGDTKFIYNVGGKLDNLVQGSNHYRFIATFQDGSTKTYSMTYYVYCGGGAEKAKPVIYLYPKKKSTVKVSVAPQGGVIESIPEMGKQWKVTAWPDGKIYDKKTKKEYPYLYWESKDNPTPIDTSTGFVVQEADLQSFFQEKLAVLGLNNKEIADFTEYWVPELSGKPYVFITFYKQERIDQEAPLTVSPKPDSVIRVYFDHQKLDEAIETQEQELIPAERTGFAVVEWGGRRYR